MIRGNDTSISNGYLWRDNLKATQKNKKDGVIQNEIIVAGYQGRPQLAYHACFIVVIVVSLL